MRAFANFILRRAGWVATLGTLLAFVGGYYSIQLYKNLRTNFEELLPTDARAVLDLKEVTQRLQSIDSLAVLIFSKETGGTKRLVVDLARELNRLPPDLVSSVEFEIRKELRFFKDRQALYMDLPDLIRVRDYISDRIEYEKQLYNPLNIFSDEEIPEPKLDFMALRQKYQGRGGSYERFPDGFYATPDETKRAIIIYVPGGLGVNGGARLRAEVDRILAELKPATYASDVEIRFAGGVQDMLEEHHALIEDLELSTILVMVLVTVAMVVFYRSIRSTIALMFSLLMGTLWTFGASYFAVGYLNANSAFLGSIVIGNGINFGIILLARYIEERRAGGDNHRAIRQSMMHTATATWTAALAAGLSYGSLILTGFRGFRQFGIIGLIGMVLCWVSAFTLLPAYLTVLDRWKPLISKQRRVPRAVMSRLFAAFIDRFPGPIWAFSLLLTIASLAMFTRYSSGILETNLSKLRNKESIERGSAYLSKYLDEIFQRYLSPLVAMPRDREDARGIAARLRQIKKEQGKTSLIASVQTLDDFIPSDQPRKIAVLKEIQALLPKKFLVRISENDRNLVSQFLTPESLRPVQESDLPKLILSKFTERDGSIGKLVLVEPPLGNELWDGQRLIGFVDGLRAAADSVAPGTPVAGSITVSSDMIKAIGHDGPRATLFAFLAVIILVVFLFRNVQTITLVLFSLMLGVLWLAGFILGFGFKINFLNFIALPITFGIGVDYGVNIFQRYREEGGGNILNVIRHTGGAVALCSFTTITGYCSLLIAGNQGFVSFGTLSVIGELTCVFAAIISLPSYLILRHRRRMLKETI